MTGVRGTWRLVWLWKAALVAVAALAIALALVVGCGEDKGPEPGLAVVPDSAELEVSSSQQFAVDLNGDSPAVSWYVDGVRGGSPRTGMVTKTGFYVAPAAVPAGGTVTLTAKAASDSTQQATAEIRITKTAESAYITIDPESSVVMPGGEVQLTKAVFGCASDTTTWSLPKIWGSPTEVGHIINGVYHAPLTPSESFGLMIRAISQACEDKSGIAKIVVNVPAAGFSVELEAFSETHNLGGAAIAKSYCGNASGQYQVTGMDEPGEWIRVPVHVPVAGTYAVSLQYQSETTGQSVEALTVEGLGEPPPGASFSVLPGAGIG